VSVSVSVSVSVRVHVKHMRDMRDIPIGEKVIHRTTALRIAVVPPPCRSHKSLARGAAVVRVAHAMVRVMAVSVVEVVLVVSVLPPRTTCTIAPPLFPGSSLFKCPED
jgi:hypothetical protein